jgi:hypothetical protein
MAANVLAVVLRYGRIRETTTLLSESNNQSIMMNPTGTKFSGDMIVSQSDLRAGTASERIINEEYVNKNKRKKEVNRIATCNVRSLGVCDKLENIQIEMKILNIDIIGMSEINGKDEGDFWRDNYRVIYSGNKNSNT